MIKQKRIKMNELDLQIQVRENKAKIEMLNNKLKALMGSTFRVQG